VTERSRKWWATGLGLAAVGVMLIAAFATAVPGPTGQPSGSLDAKLSAVAPATPATASGLAANAPTPIKHVFLILMENEQTSVIYGNQPYETKLANKYAWGGDANSNPDHTGYYANCHPSAPNYLALTSGLSLQCGSDSFSNYSVNNLGNLLDTAHESWIDYEESASQHCQQTDSLNGLYVVRHNPFVYYSDLGGRTAGSACMTHVVPIDNLTNDYPYAAVPPAFTYIAPNILNDGHSSSAATGDSWLASFLPNLVKQSYFASSVVFVVYDEGYLANGNENFSGYDHFSGGPVYMVAASPYTVGMGPLGYNASHFNLLSTMEWLLGLPATGNGHDGTAMFPVLTSLFQPRVFGPNVDLAATHLPGAELQGLNLRGDDLAGADLEDANLQGADLQGADLAGADLAGANLAGANLSWADLGGASLSGAHLNGATLVDADLAGATLTGVSASEETDFDGADLWGADLTQASCGTPNYITATGATLHAIGVPASCHPPL
jgi:hypothetical protein